VGGFPSHDPSRRDFPKGSAQGHSPQCHDRLHSVKAEKSGAGAIVTDESLTGKKPTFTDWLLKGPRIDDLELPRRKASSMRGVSL
jgi:hypothetical protein